MAAPIALYANRTLLAKQEATYGLDPVPTGAANAVLSMEGSIQVEADKLERDIDSAYLGAHPYVLVNKRATVQFKIDLLGAATAGTAAPCGPILRACGMSETLNAALATPVNAAFTTSTTGGSLAATTAYWYRVSAINAYGETLASAETSITTGAGATNTVTVNWGAVAGATGYKVYGRTTGGQLLIATVGAVTTYTDTGSITPAGALPTANTTAHTLYAPVSSGFTSLTIYFYHSGLLFKVTGARGNLETDLSIGQFGSAMCTFTGIIDTASPTEVAPGAVTLTAWRTPPAVETATLSCTQAGTAINIKSHKLALNNEPTIYEGSEAREISIRERKPSLAISMYQEALATWNVWSDANAHTNRAIVAAVIGGATKNVTVNTPTTQFEYPRLNNGDGAMCWDVSGHCVANVGNDEFSIVFH